MTIKYSKKDFDVIIILPVFNEEKNIKYVCIELIEKLSQGNYNFQILLVDDGSTDDTLSEIEQLSSSYEEVKYISFSRNFGKEIAIMAGIREIRDTFDFLGYMDSDGQHNPEDLIRMLEYGKDGNFDIICGRRHDRRYQKLTSKIASLSFYHIFSKLAGFDLESGVGDFNIFRANVANALINCGDTRPFVKGLVSWIGFKCGYVDIKIRDRNDGLGKFSVFKAFKLGVSAILSFSSWPIRSWSILGGIFFLIALTYMVYILVQTLVNGVKVPGYASTIILLLGFGGVQLLSLGIIGEYIGRIYDSSKNRPLYIISKRSK